jgi:hypothetical protein
MFAAGRMLWRRIAGNRRGDCNGASFALVSEFIEHLLMFLVVISS